LTDSSINKKRILKHSAKAEARALKKSNLQYARNVKFFVKMLLDHFIAEKTEEYRKKGKNVNNSRTKSSIEYWAKKEIIDNFGVNPDNILSTSPNKLVEVLYRTRTQKEPTITRERWDDGDVSNLYKLSKDELGPIGRDILNEPQKWISTKSMIHKYLHEIKTKEYSRNLSEEVANEERGLPK
jgi:hypothetical protein